MKTFVSGLFLLVAAGWAGGPVAAQAKPHATPTPAAVVKAAPEIAADAAPGGDASGSLARWLLEQNGGPGAVVLPLAQVVQAATGKTVVPVDRKNPADAAFIQRLGGLMDVVLPEMNKPDSAARAARPEGMAAAFEEALAAKLRGSPGVTFTGPEALARPQVGGSYPACRVVDQASSRTYYLGVGIAASGERAAAAGTLCFHPAESAAWFAADGSCLFVAIETNGKAGKEAAFLNWELIDLAKLPVHATMTFEGSQGEIHAPGGLLDDGRKGRD